MFDVGDAAFAFGAKKRKRKVYVGPGKTLNVPKKTKTSQVTAQVVKNGKIAEVELDIVGFDYFVDKPCALLKSLSVVDSDSAHSISTCQSCYNKYVRNGMQDSSEQHFVQIRKGSEPNEIYILKLRKGIHGRTLPQPHIAVSGEFRWHSDCSYDKIVKLAQKQQAKFAYALSEVPFEWMKSMKVPRDQILRKRTEAAFGYKIRYLDATMSVPMIRFLKGVVDVLVRFKQMPALVYNGMGNWEQCETVITNNISKYPLKVYQFLDTNFMLDYWLQDFDLGPLFRMAEELNDLPGVTRSIEFLSNRRLIPSTGLNVIRRS